MNKLILPPVLAAVNFLNLLINLKAIPPGIPNSRATALISPTNVSGFAKSDFSYRLFNSSVNSVGNTASGIENNKSPTLYAKLVMPVSKTLLISSTADR